MVKFTIRATNVRPGGGDLMQENLTPTKEKTKKLLKRILAAFLAVVLIATSTMLVDALIVRREALKYRESMGLSAESAKWDRQLVELNEHVESGDYDLALEDVNKAMKKGADKEPGMWLKKAAIEVLLEDYDSALSDIAVSISMDPGDSDAHCSRPGRLYVAIRPRPRPA
jgi:tetratricopeptide (TPR) repeat protein